MPANAHVAESNDSKLCILQDPRVDVCVYFIAPHRLKQIDIEFMKRLSVVSKISSALCHLPATSLCAYLQVMQQLLPLTDKRML